MLADCGAAAVVAEAGQAQRFGGDGRVLVELLERSQLRLLLA
jgi:hypothetical protein